MRIKIKQIDNCELGLKLRPGAKVKTALMIADIPLDNVVVRDGIELSLNDTLKQGDVLYIPPKKITSDK